MIERGLLMKWEYATIQVAATGFMGGKLNERAFTDAMNDLGNKGWELVCAFDTSQGAGMTRDVIAVLKRPKP